MWQIFVRFFSAAAVAEEAKYPCADYKPGDDDLQSFDFIRKFELGTIANFSNSLRFIVTKTYKVSSKIFIEQSQSDLLGVKM
jgi:hypothetical protein